MLFTPTRSARLLQLSDVSTDIERTRFAAVAALEPVQYGATENAGVENAGVETSARK